MDNISLFVTKINGVLVAYILVFGLLGVGLFYTFYLKIPQIFKFKNAFRQTFATIFHKNGTKEEISSFQALAVSISAQVGTGNIVGVASAISLGGAGAIFWMWVSAFLGMSTIIAEAMLAQKYRVLVDNKYIGGPAFYISQGLKNILGQKISKIMAVFFSIAIIIALGFCGQMTQANSIASSINDAFGVDKIIVGVALAIFAGLIIIGGIKRIASFAQLVVPIMAFLYLSCAIFILFKFNSEIINVIKYIISEAFTPTAVAGGGVGITIKEAVRYGVARGLFSNEAGMGSTPHAHASAKVKYKYEQGLVAMLAVFVDTMIICTATAFIILLSGVDLNFGPNLTQEAFKLAFGHFGSKILAVCLTFFAFTTIIGWYYFAQTNVLFLFSKKILPYFQTIVLFFIVIGTIFRVNLVWDLSDLFNTLMVLPNLIALILMAPEVKKMFFEKN